MADEIVMVRRIDDLSENPQTFPCLRSAVNFAAEHGYCPVEDFPIALTFGPEEVGHPKGAGRRTDPRPQTIYLYR
jgi:hypothetical protein